MKEKVLYIILGLLLIGCAPPPKVQKENVAPIANIVVNEKISSQSNYKIGEVKSAYVGESLIKKKTYKVRTENKLVAIPLMNVSLFSERIKLSLMEGREYPVQYQVKREQVPFRVIEIQNANITNSNEVYGVMFDNSGLIFNKILENGVETKDILEIHPINAAVKVTTNEKEVSRELIEDYDISYAGSASNQIKLIYRENGQDKSGITQELTYPADSNEIRFRNIKIKLHKTTPESLIYQVESE